ncbi:MAG TPA: MerR family transcriptional regulator [Clostridia bacterium]|nr:MerR family transcriptional regulator [Clostridia bacterium]HPK14869.1 MerR family transcriptional regulator [Clostridia bacterium]
MKQLMRIGAFAARFGLPISTVRYYIQRGFIVPESRNGQFLFDEYCIGDMRRIEAWKRMRFSLNEIHELISLYRKYPNSVVEQEAEYQRFYRNKREELIRLKDENEASCARVEAMLDQLPHDR